MSLVSCIRSYFAVAGACDTAARAPFPCRYGPIRHGVTLGLLRTDLRFGTLVVRHVTIFGRGHGLQRAIIDESQHRTPERLIMAQH